MVEESIVDLQSKLRAAADTVTPELADLLHEAAECIDALAPPDAEYVISPPVTEEVAAGFGAALLTEVPQRSVLGWRIGRLT